MLHSIALTVVGALLLFALLYRSHQKNIAKVKDTGLPILFARKFKNCFPRVAVAGKRSNWVTESAWPTYGPLFLLSDFFVRIANHFEFASKWTWIT